MLETPSSGIFPFLCFALHQNSSNGTSIFLSHSILSLKLQCGFCPTLYRNGSCQGLCLVKPSGQTSVAFFLPSQQYLTPLSSSYSPLIRFFWFKLTMLSRHSATSWVLLPQSLLLVISLLHLRSGVTTHH